jgi:putative tryptophan/tyrosine transport system substrate-binding protein
VRRPELITLLSGGVAWPLTVRAQELDRVRRIGVPMGDAEDWAASVAAFREELRKLGWTEGRNIELRIRSVV